MEITEHLAALRVDSDLMATAIAAAGPDAPIPTCPDWVMRDLVRHTGVVHRWARANVAKPSDAPADPDEAAGALPPDASLVDWFREGVADLANTLEAAPEDLACWSFLPAPSPVAFWARRQCHETGMHRADAEGASGAVTPFAPAVASDGIDELLTAFITRRGGRLASDEPRTLGVHTTDTNDDWIVHIADQVTTTRGHDDAECVISATASDVHLFLWNRLDRSQLHVTGDASLLDKWRDSVTVRWGR